MIRAVYFDVGDWLSHVWAQCTDNPEPDKLRGFVVLESVRPHGENRIVPRITCTLITAGTIVQVVQAFGLKVYSHENTTETAFDRAQRLARQCRAQLRRFGIEPVIGRWSDTDGYVPGEVN